MFLVVPAIAQEDDFDVEIEITHLLTSTPVAHMEFSEPVTVDRAEFIRLDALGIDIDYIIEAEINQLSVQTYNASPIQGLTNGYYYFEVEAADNVGNVKIFRKEFALIYPTLDIQIIDPPLGVTDSTPFDLTIKTFFKDQTYTQAQCKYSTIDPKDNFDAEFLFDFDQSVGALHTIDDFSIIANLIPNVPSPPYFFICIDADSRPSTKRMYALIDTITPAISSLSFDPQTIIEFPLGGDFFKTDMVVGATEPVLCKYSLNETLPFEQMTPVGEYDVDDYESYTESLRETIYLPTIDKVTYDVTVICRDRAGFLSPPKVDQIKVDLSASIGINVISPGDYDQGDNITLMISTAKLAFCEYAEDEGSKITLSTESNPLKSHTALLGFREEGTHTLDISCHSGAAGMFQDQVLTHKYIVDRTPPGTPTINGSIISCSATSVDVTPPLTFSAEDLHSGIATFEYTLPEYGINQTGSSISDISLPADTNLTPGSIVDIVVTAIDNVGLRSGTTTVSVTYDPNHPDCLEKNKPKVNINQEKFPGEVKVTMTCTDDTGCNDGSFLYGLDIGGNCTPFQNYLGYFSVYQTQTVCYYVEDKVGNNATGSARITVEVGANCGNGIKDADEAGVDCGGPCGASCGIGGPCTADKDCLSGYCANGKCAEPSCDDGVQNGKESGIDCGGASDCDGCGIGSSCFTNSDCMTNFCHPDSKTCEEGDCTDGFTGGSETDEDCGGDCAACGNGMKCNSNADCISGNCAAGYCTSAAGPADDTPVITPVEDEGGSAFPLIILILGLLMVAGGVGYLMYKHGAFSFKPKAAKTAVPGAPPRPGAPPSGAQPPPGMPGVQGAPGMPGAPGAPTGMSRQMLERLKEQKERQKHLAELIKEKLEKNAEDKRDKRSKVFDTFAPAKPMPKTEKAAKPAEKMKIAETAQIEPEVTGDWVSVGDLNKSMKEKKDATAKAEKQKSEKPKKPIDVGEDVALLDRVAKKEEDLFDKLPGKDMKTEEGKPDDIFARLPGKKGTEKIDETADESDEDIFKRMEERGRKEELSDDAFDKLGKKNSKKNALKDLEE